MNGEAGAREVASSAGDGRLQASRAHTIYFPGAPSSDSSFNQLTPTLTSQEIVFTSPDTP